MLHQRNKSSGALYLITVCTGMRAWSHFIQAQQTLVQPTLLIARSTWTHQAVPLEGKIFPPLYWQQRLLYTQDDLDCECSGAVIGENLVSIYAHQATNHVTLIDNHCRSLRIWLWKILRHTVYTSLQYGHSTFWYILGISNMVSILCKVRSSIDYI